MVNKLGDNPNLSARCCSRGASPCASEVADQTIAARTNAPTPLQSGLWGARGSPSLQPRGQRRAAVRRSSPGPFLCWKFLPVKEFPFPHHGAGEPGKRRAEGGRRAGLRKLES